MTSNHDDFDDDFDDLKAAFAATTPRPDAGTKAAHLALAQENFDALLGSGQGSRSVNRLTLERPKPGVFQGVIAMLNSLTTKAGLTITTALVAVGFLTLSPVGQSLWKNGAPVSGEGDVQLIPESPVEPDAPLSDLSELRES